MLLFPEQGQLGQTFSALAERIVLEREAGTMPKSAEEGLGLAVLKAGALCDEIGHLDRVWRQVKLAALNLGAVALHIALLADDNDPYREDPDESYFK